MASYTLDLYAVNDKKILDAEKDPTGDNYFYSLCRIRKNRIKKKRLCLSCTELFLPVEFGQARCAACKRKVRVR